MKLYAIVSPSVTLSGDALVDLSFFVVAPYHKLNYEFVCGYSLGHKPEFCNTLQEVKKLFNEIVNSPAWISRRLTQKAIVELELDENNQITAFLTITTVVKANEHKIYRKVSEEKYEEELTYEAVFEEKEILKTDYTAGALNEINRQYQKHLNKEQVQNAQDNIPEEEGAYCPCPKFF